MNKGKVAIIGAGRVGTALAVLLRRQGYPIAAVASRTLASAQRCAELTECELLTTSPSEAAKAAEIIFITVPDGEIRAVCEAIARGGGFKKGDLVIHTSGALDSDELSSAKERAALILSMHPVQSFSEPESAIENLPGSYFGLEGEEEAVERGKVIVKDLDGKAVMISREAKALYHAAACVVSNYLVGLLDLSLTIYEKAGIAREKAIEVLLPLAKGTIANVESLGVPSALTGPIERGEVEIIRRQMASINDRAPELLGVFRDLVRYTLGVAKEKGTLTREKVEELTQLLKKR